ncbi:MAG: glycosyltransferase family 2 protein [Bryobacteraceae bacterium]|jgi:glycosyltransferase involved in cell wall biosynthesis
MTEDRNDPSVSIIIPTKDRCGLLLETLASVRSQTYQHWEAVVVDDLSSDTTWPALLELAAEDPRIRPLRRAGPAGGAQVARNQGLSASRGSFVIFLDSDDLLTPDALAGRLRNATAHPEADAIVFVAEHFTGSPGLHADETAYRMNVFDGVEALDAFLAYHAPWYTSGPLWRRAAIDRVGPWDVTLPFGQDLEYHIRALTSGIRFQQLAEVDQYHRGHDGARVSQSNGLSNISKRLALLDRVIALLRSNKMLTPRRRRMLAWSAFWGTIGYSLERPRPQIRTTLRLWRGAYERGLVGRSAYWIGSLVALSQLVNGLRAFGRELARWVFYSHLKKKPLLHPILLRTLVLQLRWRLRRCRMGRHRVVANTPLVS